MAESEPRNQSRVVRRQYIQMPVYLGKGGYFFRKNIEFLFTYVYDSNSALSHVSTKKKGNSLDNIIHTVLSTLCSFFI